MNKKIQTTINGEQFEIDLQEIEEMYQAVKNGPGDTSLEKLTNALEGHPDLKPDLPRPIVPSGPGQEDE